MARSGCRPTAIQAKVLNYICWVVATGGVVRHRDVAEHLGRHVRNIHCHVNALRKKGLIASPPTPRSHAPLLPSEAGWKQMRSATVDAGVVKALGKLKKE